ncbi:MAG: thioredoxin family protein [Desulfobacterales bacterium]|nr:MAG: thioredoxin family protein [Desulfobacterales bacterium]
MEIKVLGPGCARCNQLERDLIAVMTEMDMPVDLEHVTDIAEIGSYGVMGTPALVINREVKTVGSIPPKTKLKKWLQEAFTKQSDNKSRKELSHN